MASLSDLDIQVRNYPEFFAKDEGRPTVQYVRMYDSDTRL